MLEFLQTTGAKMMNLDQFFWELEEVSQEALDLKDKKIKDHIVDTTLRFAENHFNDYRVWEDGLCLNTLSDVEIEMIRHGFDLPVATLVQSHINAYYFDYQARLTTEAYD